MLTPTCRSSPFAGRVDDVEQVIGDRVVHPDVPDRPAGAQDVVGREHRAERLDRLAGAVAREDLPLLGPDRVAHPQPDHEPVELALGQDVGPLELVRVLGREHDERRVERIGLPLDRDLAVAHRLEQGALGPRGRPVDLVGQDHVGEDRARLEDELAASPRCRRSSRGCPTGAGRA